MGFENKILSREISQLIWENDKTIGTAESCTGGRIAEAIIAMPGASNYFKGGIISYTNEIKENLLGVSHELIEEKTAVSEEVAKEMVRGAIKALKLSEDFGRDINLAKATTQALQLFLQYLLDRCDKSEEKKDEGYPEPLFGQQ